ncbi:hypothetical protein ABZ883_12440 [Streptomyces sp. NPDC046977]|uniref:hypothetical protein n=1 Tax=Streptomyces sp. NPDC046977 TaxID=3154703 RepID=UPI0033D62EE5
MEPEIPSYILVPEDPVFASKFRTVEEPLLYSLHFWYRGEIPAHQSDVVDTAYSSYGEVLRSFPARLRRLIWECTSGQSDRDSPGESADPPLPRLHPVAVRQSDLDSLDRCCRMLRTAHREGPTNPLGEILDELGEGIDLADTFSRVLQVLRLPAPQGLIARSLGSRTPHREEHVQYCSEMIRALSDGDEFQQLAHRALYRTFDSATN